VNRDESAKKATSITLSGDASASMPSTRMRFWLEYGGRPLELRGGIMTLGRSAVCQFVFDDVLVSRRHAEFTVTPASVTLRDLGSANGVFVNEKRLNAAYTLEPGDRIAIGKQQMVFRSGPASSGLSESRQQRFMAETLHGSEAPKSDEGPSIEVIEDPDSTHQGDALELLGSVADKVLALGRGPEAERVLSGSLLGILEAARTGSVQAATAERAVQYSVKLATATGKGRWVDYTFELYRMLQRPLPADVVDQLYTVLRSVSGVNLQALREYVAVLRAAQRQFGPSERFVVQRIEGLERLAALK
jgi:hypothetical protein